MPDRTHSIVVTHADRRRRWLAHIRAWQQSSLTQRAYCERHQIGYASFVRWRRIIRDQSSDSTTGNGDSDRCAFIPVSVVGGSDAQPAGGVSVTLPNGTRISGVTPQNVELVATLVASL